MKKHKQKKKVGGFVRLSEDESSALTKLGKELGLSKNMLFRIAVTKLINERDGLLGLLRTGFSK